MVPAQASLNVTPGSVRHVVSSQRILPKINVAATATKPKPMTRPSDLALLTSREAGCCIDYIQVTTTNDFRFQSDTTYLIPNGSTVYLSGTTVIEGGTVIKYDRKSSIEIDGDIQCATGPYRPAYLTAIDDNTVGAALSSGSPSGTYADTALILSGSPELKYLVIRYANEGIFSGFDFSVNHSQFLHCNYGIHTEFGNPYAGNDLFVDVGTTFYGSWYRAFAENITVDGNYGYLSDDHDFHSVPDGIDCDGIPSSSLALTNCIIFNVFTNGFQGVDQDHVYWNANSDVYPFQIVGGGSHYLVDAFHNSGTTNVRPTLLADLRNKTTYPPTIFSQTNLAYPIALFPCVPKDAGETIDAGYHYDPIDFEFGATVITNPTPLAISAGTKIATFGIGTNACALNYALSPIRATGTPLNPIWICAYNTVQENDPSGWARSTNGMISASNSIFSFTWWSSPAQDCWLAPPSIGAPSGFRDCRFLGGTLSAQNASLNLTNCLLDRTYTTMASTGASLQIRNNLFRGGHCDITIGTTFASIKDNLFNLTDLTVTATGFDADYNAYVTNTALSTFSRITPAATHDVLITNVDFQSGPLCDYYYPTSGGMLSQLIDAGSVTNAGLAGMFHYTTDTNYWGGVEVTEGSTRLDIGWHQVAVDGNGNPVDVDGDGLPDYLEDTNGNGIYDAPDLSDLNSADTDSDGVNDFIELLQGRNPRASGTIADTNNLIILQVHTPLH